MVDGRVRGEAPLLWVVLLTVASLLTTLVFACATPFPSLAALAAVHMTRRDGLALITAAWVVSQATGFCVMGYPWDVATALNGIAIGTGALASLLAASLADDRVAMRSTAGQLVIAYLTAFVGFKVGVALWAPVMAHAGAGFTPTVLVRQFLRYAAVLAGLHGLFRLLLAAGVPAPMVTARRRPATA